MLASLIHSELAVKQPKLITRYRPKQLHAAKNCSLRNLNMLAGWREYEYRQKLDNFGPIQQFIQPRWTGAENLQGKRILVQAEQGFGDTLQFIRYAKCLATRNAIVFVLAPKPLERLAASCPGVTAVYTAGESIPPFDFHIPMMSLPLACQTELGNRPAEVPYLSATPDVIAKWKALLGERMGLRIGLVWSGDPRSKQREVSRAFQMRNLRFDQLRPLLEIPAATFYSLQLGVDATRQLQGDASVTDLTSQIFSFEDTAALIAQLDLVISVDTSVVHLAGALGKPVWILNRYNTCWRWFLDREDSPWYPTARIFRQPVPGDWASVIKNARNALEELVQT